MRPAAIERRGRRAGGPLSFVLAWLVSACGVVPPPLPPELPGPSDVVPTSGDAARGAPLLRDRALGRTGYACADCHRLEPGGPRRPGPPLPSRGGVAQRTLARAVSRCVERYLSRPALDGARLGDLLAALAEGARRADVEPRGPRDGGAIYDRACRHCHEGGPAGPVAGCAWRRADLLRAVRGIGRSRHPVSWMPAYAPARFDAVAFERLSDWLLDPPRGASCQLGNGKIE